MPRRRRQRFAPPRRRRQQQQPNRDARIIRAFTTPGHPVAFSTPTRVAKFFNIDKGKAQTLLEGVEGYVLHREFKQPRIYNPYYVHNRRQQVQADLIDIAQLANKNGGIRFLLVIIDIFTKYLWVFPLRTKEADTMVRALNRWIAEIDVKPKKMLTDRGTEFINRQVQALLRTNNIEWKSANGTLKACIAERVNKTIQILIFKYLSENETERYIHVLPQLVETYNKRGHRTLQNMSPAEADRPANERVVQAIFHEKYEKIGQHRREPKYKVNDFVLVKTDPKKISSEARAYAPQFRKNEFFRIERINRTFPIPMYHLRSMERGDLIDGGFYSNELQRVQGDIYRIERVLDRRVNENTGVREILVKWVGFGPDFNDWIPAANVTRVF